MLRDQFYEVMEEWVSHCGKTEVVVDSSSNSVRDCDAYRNILAMSQEALPFIREIYGLRGINKGVATVQHHGLSYLVQEIIGEEFSIPQEIQGKVDEIKDYVKNWLDENMRNYIEI